MKRELNLGAHGPFVEGDIFGKGWLKKLRGNCAFWSSLTSSLSRSLSLSLYLPSSCRITHVCMASHSSCSGLIYSLAMLCPRFLPDAWWCRVKRHFFRPDADACVHAVHPAGLAHAESRPKGSRVALLNAWVYLFSGFSFGFKKKKKRLDIHCLKGEPTGNPPTSGATTDNTPVCQRHPVTPTAGPQPPAGAQFRGRATAASPPPRGRRSGG